MFKIIAQHTDFIVVNKSAGVNFHDEDEQGQGLFSQVKKQQQSVDSRVMLFPVHRLDKMTSGLVIFAKNLETAQQFQQLFSAHLIEKYYLALSESKPKKKQGLIKGDMVKSRRGTWKLLRTMENPAVSQFFSYAITFNNSDKSRLFLIKPHSGKTHQIRVALSSIGSAITGDPMYNAHSVADRGYLHAYAIRFTLKDESFQFITEPDSGCLFLDGAVEDQLTMIGKPWQLAWPKC